MATAQRTLLLYDAPSCWKCVEVKQALDALGLEYSSVTVRGNPAARAALVALQGEPPQVPMLLDGGLAVWDRRRILAYIDRPYGTGEGPAIESLPGWMGGSCSLEGDGAC